MSVNDSTLCRQIVHWYCEFTLRVTRSPYPHGVYVCSLWTVAYVNVVTLLACLVALFPKCYASMVCLEILIDLQRKELLSVSGYSTRYPHPKVLTLVSLANFVCK